MKNLLLISLFSLATVAHSQMNEGYYSYSGEGVKVQMKVTDSGYTVKGLTMTLSDGTNTFCTGEWQSVPETADGNYSGPSGWYVIYYGNCAFEIYLLGETKIIISRTTCSDSSKLITKKKIVLQLN